jgi:MarR-like DNA-binding transcriptional regulator SgrR of sgrS sRNA
LIILEKYIALFLHFQESINQDITTSIEEISEILFCTPRNSKSVLKKLVNLGWINWISGMGRGNKSKLIFLKQPHNLIMEKCMELVKHGEIKSAWNLINSYRDMYPNLTAEFSSWIDTLFGYNIETDGSKKLDILRLKIDVTPIVVQLDPIEATFRSDRHILRQISDTLLHYNSTSKQFEPRIAFFWEYNKTRQSWYIYLNKGIKFHNGKHLTSKDVLYTFNRFKTSSNNACRWMLKDLENINAIDDYTLEFNLKNINHLFLYFLCDERLSILPCPDNKNIERKIDKFLIGTGPFKIAKNDGDILVLEANDNYFMRRAFLDRVELWGVKDKTTASTNPNEIKYGLYPKQMTNNTEYNDFKQMDYLDKSTQYLTINLNKKGPFENPHFKKAFRNILNTNNMIRELGGERYESAEGFVFSNNSNETFLDCNCIKPLLAKSNYKGESLNLYTYDHGLDHIEDAGWIQKECAKFGIMINIKLLSSEALLDTEIIDEADIIHDSCTINESLEISYLDMLLSDTSFIKHHLDPDLKNELDTKVTELYRNDQETKRIELLKNIERALIQHNNVIPLYRSQLNLQSHNIIQNVFINTFGWIDFYHIWFKKK